jgi:hypothetical protein
MLLKHMARVCILMLKHVIYWDWHDYCNEEGVECFSTGLGFNTSGTEEAKMNDAEVNMQIQQMVHFIRQEAEEKANEIAVSAAEVFISTTQTF